MKTVDDMVRSTHDPIRWADMPAEHLGAAGKLLVSPAPIKALPSEVAMRVRRNVLNSATPSVSPAEFGSLPGRHAATFKLAGVAAGAALFGASAMTVLSSAQEATSTPVVVAPAAPSIDVDAQTNGANAHERLAGARLSEARRTNPDDADPATIRTAEVTEGSVASSRVSEKAARVSVGSDGEPNRVAFPQDAQADLSVARLGERGDVSTMARDRTNPNTSDQGPAVVAPRAALGQHSEQELALLAPSEVVDRPVVRPQFRRVTARKTAARQPLTSLEEETRLLEDARSKLGRAPQAALSLALEHQSRFRQGQLLEQRRMIHLEALLRLGRDDEAKKLVASIGSSIYKARAAALLIRYGIAAQ